MVFSLTVSLCVWFSPMVAHFSCTLVIHGPYPMAYYNLKEDSWLCTNTSGTMFILFRVHISYLIKKPGFLPLTYLLFRLKSRFFIAILTTLEVFPWFERASRELFDKLTDCVLLASFWWWS